MTVQPSITRRERSVVTRSVTLTWPPGKGPLVTVIGRHRGTGVERQSAVTKAVLTYRWESAAEAWAAQADLEGVSPHGRGWSSFANPILGFNSPESRDLVKELHRTHKPTTTVTVTERQATAMPDTIYPRLGDIYEDRDPRSDNRRVKVIAQAPSDSRGRPRVAVETVTNDGNPGTVGRETTVGLHTLANRFQKVSH